MTIQEDSCKTVLDWFLNELSTRPSRGYEIERTDGQAGDLGTLYGVQFNSIQRGGYVYCWTSGYVGFELVDYVSGEQLVDDCLEEAEDTEAMKAKLLTLTSLL